ncbi:molybdopterin adenylyltransferase [Campylobacter canadensis]|uniref:Molybdopterin adenylyltransferase n=1 Tax=Campylobacter canadensis TaxID=449520 RepID=A0ABS7WPC2_9BACT|nr:molybdopterin adenylyltransferase [Campylobacter canadensis]MBZ7986612.1 molybdopterin adenylyltransferase [Campylobacter canadensis]MBZ7997648.1 molybdopterin adenylyltransferase [Campylobacter canadensis]
MQKIKISIITCSDRASSGVYEDLSGKQIKNTLTSWIANEIEFFYHLIPDEKQAIKNALELSCNEQKCDLVFTTGGTGPALRDITPEVTKDFIQKELPGFAELMRMTSLKYTPTAILSRQIAGIYNNSLIINLPGKPKAIVECLEPIFGAIPYCLDLINAAYIEVKDNAPKIFRPKS